MFLYDGGSLAERRIFFYEKKRTGKKEDCRVLVKRNACLGLPAYDGVCANQCREPNAGGRAAGSAGGKYYGDIAGE